MHQIELFIKYPVDVQMEWMSSLLRNGSNTEYGKTHKFSEIKNYLFTPLSQSLIHITRDSYQLMFKPHLE